ncbi:TorF family putative porin [Polynucleobacter corsicus]|uniref:TorF family putative porin n=1 Tax=Polynucleobacter corsicus TaxID=2081042 RepID=UPI001BFDA05C|nr:TorF family putative porin [Polynucleobacter corsicus]QWE18565.1 hypothetical protein C2747_09800 [Polynucleobacter corsicus]
MKTIQKSAIALAASGLFATAAFAQTAPAAAPEAPEVSPITANVTVASSYVYRGLTQTNNKPAIQGGFDYAHDSGFYVGNWNSNISWISDGYNQTPTTTAPIEMDFYAGVKKELIGEGFVSDVGVLQYYYPTSGMPGISKTLANAGATRQLSGTTPSTTEIYAAQNYTFGAVTGFVKFSYGLTNLFGINNSKGSLYPDLTTNYDTGFYGVSLNAHVGYQYVPNDIQGYKMSYTDWKLGLTKDFGGGLTGAVAYTGTNIAKAPGSSSYVYTTANGGSAGKATGIVSLTKTF